jgi:hypothetical protein
MSDFKIQISLSHLSRYTLHGACGDGQLTTIISGGPRDQHYDLRSSWQVTPPIHRIQNVFSGKASDRNIFSPTQSAACDGEKT